jgi:hypothetical protein
VGDILVQAAAKKQLEELGKKSGCGAGGADAKCI